MPHRVACRMVAVAFGCPIMKMPLLALLLILTPMMVHAQDDAPCSLKIEVAERKVLLAGEPSETLARNRPDDMRDLATMDITTLDGVGQVIGKQVFDGSLDRDIEILKAKFPMLEACQHVETPQCKDNFKNAISFLINPECSVP